MLLCIAISIVTSVSDASKNRRDILNSADLHGWEEQIFSGETEYTQVIENGLPVLKARSYAAASGMIRKIKVDLTATPYINWSWKVENVLDGVNETEKSGDDYSARVYVVVSGGILFWKTRALSYTWASQQTVGSHWPNAFSGNAVMVAVESGEEFVGEWRNEKRNVRDDIRNLLGMDVSKIDAVAIMTDTDNSQQSAVAYYGNIFFTAE